ncbi:hypothetical protein P9869_01405 [Streptomyces ossamyceticus]|nr:hypothetical protein [Streptomyces ossamyceticus]
MPWPRLRDTVHLAYRTSFQLDAGSDLRHRMWFEHADRNLRAVLDLLDDLGAIERDRGMADPVFLDIDPSDVGPELLVGMPPEVAELLGVDGAATDPAARERADARREELRSGCCARCDKTHSWRRWR